MVCAEAQPLGYDIIDDDKPFILSFAFLHKLRMMQSRVSDPFIR